jgi:hypothetical protein
MSNPYYTYPTHGKTKNVYGMIIFTYCGKVEVIDENKPFTLLRPKFDRLVNEPRFKCGKLELKYYIP